MARKTNKKNFHHSSFRRPSFRLPAKATRQILAVVMFALALIFSLAFFEKAGAAGNFFLVASQFLLGKGIFLLPLSFAVTGLVLLRMKEGGSFTPLLALLIVLGGVSGILGVLAHSQGQDGGGHGGWVGFLLSWPVFTAFGLWVSEIIFGALVFIGGIIFWHLLPHEEQKKVVAPESVQEKIKKIFAPKFELKTLEPEPKIQGEILKGPAFPQEKKTPSSPQSNHVELLPLMGEYTFPPTNLLEGENGLPNAGDIKNYSAIIKKTLQNFDIPVEISEVNVGPTVTQYAFKPAEGIKLSRITALSNDLALALAAHPIRIEAPIPGRALVGVEIPNKIRTTVRLRSLIENPLFQNFPSPLALVLGRDVSGNPVYSDLAKMPHLLVAGATGAGKTIFLNTIILSFIYRNSPLSLRFILIDPKRVEFSVYNDLPHLLTPVVLDVQRTVNVLKWLVKEMERRFEILSSARARDIGSYHALIARQKQQKSGHDSLEEEQELLPYIVVIIDELADLMAARGKDIEALIVRLAQMARAVGIHLVLATQRPSVEVITGLIKANITARVAFQVASQVDSRTILDMGGAEKLLGQGDMLFISAESSKPKRIQSPYASEKDVKRVVSWIAKETKDFERTEITEDELEQSALQEVEPSGAQEGEDPLYEEAKRVVIEAKKASASLLQRRLKIGYARAARLLDILEERGVVGPGEGAKPREVYIQPEENGSWVSPKL